MASIDRELQTIRQANKLVAILDNRDEVVRIVRSLHAAGFGSDRISLLAKDTTSLDRTVREAETMDGRDDESIDDLADEIAPKGHEEAAGMAVGGTVGFVVGLTAIAIPGFGAFLLAAGPVAIILNALTTSFAGLGLGFLIGAILDEGMTEGHRDLYRDRLEAGCWLLIVHGNRDELTRASDVLRSGAVEHVDVL